MRLISRHVEHAGPTVSPEWPVSLQYVLTPLIHGEGLSQVLSPEPMFLDQSHDGHPNGLLQAWCPVSPTGCLLQPGSKIWVQWFPFWYRASCFIKLIHEWEV